MLRSVSTVIVLVLAGFGVYMTTLISFIRPDPTNTVLQTVAVNGALTLLLIGAGAMLSRPGRRPRSIGITLISGCSLTGLVMVTLALMALPSRAGDLVPASAIIRMFLSNVPFGTCLTIGLGVLGFSLAMQRPAIDADDSGQSASAVTIPNQDEA